IEQHPEVWDRSSEKYKGAKRDAWPKIVTALFPEWPNLPTQQQTQILGDVKTRWRSVTDRYLKSLKTPSGQLAAKEEGALWRPAAVHIGKAETESNVSAQTPPDLNDGDTTVDSIGEEVEDSIMNSQESPGNMSLSGRSPEITDSLGEHDVAANTTTSTSSDAGANSGGGNIRGLSTALQNAVDKPLMPDIVPVYQIKGISKLVKLCLPKVQCFCDSLTSPPSERQFNALLMSVASLLANVCFPESVQGKDCSMQDLYQIIRLHSSMQDNARPHVAGVCQQFLQDEGIEAMDWPARSPDLNLIEHIWDIMSRTIHQCHVV
ncbi:unnamed protein product, partial [Ranitomeya imitator]